MKLCRIYICNCKSTRNNIKVVIENIIDELRNEKYYKRKAEELQWKLEAMEMLEDCNEEFEL